MSDTPTQPPRPRRRWPRRVFLSLCLLLMLGAFLLVISVPAIARYYIATSPYARFKPTIGNVTLGPTGAIAITNVTLYEPDSAAILAHADRIAVGFSWLEIFSQKIQTVRITGLTLHVRSVGDVPVSLARLADSPPSDPAATTTTAASSAPGLWIDNLLATGQCLIDPNIPIQTTTARLPISILMRTDGSRTSPEPRVDVRLGSAADNSVASPFLTGQVCYVRGRFLTFALDGQSVDLRTTQAALLEPLGPYLPQTADASHLSFGRLHIDGKIVPPSGTASASGTVRIMDLSVAALHAGQPAAAVERITFSTAFETPLNASAANAARVDATAFRIGGLSYGGHSAANFSGTLGLHEGLLVLTGGRAAYDHQPISLAAAYNVPTGGVPKLEVSATAVPAAQLTALLPKTYAQVHVFDAYDLAATLQRESAATPWQGSVTLAATSQPATPAEKQSGALTARFHGLPNQRWLIESAGVNNLHVTLSPPTLQALAPTLDPLHDSPLTIDLPAANITGTLDLAANHFSGQMDAQRLTIANTSKDDHKLDLQQLNIACAIDSPLSADALAQAILHAGTLSLASVARGESKIDQASTKFELEKGLLTFKAVDLQFAGGTIRGSLAYNAADQKLTAVALTLAHIDAHQVLKTAAPGRVDAQGTFSGTAKFSLANDQLEGKIDLFADAPGLLMISDEKIAQAIAQPLAAAKIASAPPNLSDIVVGQLQHYPWDKARVQVRAEEGRPVVWLDLTRQPMKEGEPGFGVDMVMAGQHVKVNYPVQIPGLELSIPNQSIESVLGIVTGLKALLVGPPRPPATAPSAASTSTAPSTSPLPEPH